MNEFVEKVIAWVKVHLYATLLGVGVFFLVGLKYPPATSYAPIIAGLLAGYIGTRTIR